MTTEDLYYHFRKLFGETNNSEENNNSNNNALDNDIINADIDCNITENEICHAVFSQNNDNAPSIDRLCSELFKAS